MNISSYRRGGCTVEAHGNSGVWLHLETDDMIVTRVLTTSEASYIGQALVSAAVDVDMYVEHHGLTTDEVW